MFHYLEGLFSAAQFVPHAVCLLWRPDLLAMHGISDFLIGAAYLTIPLLILQASRRRPDLIDVRVARMFAAFITACALSHLAGLLTLWVPAYGFHGVIKVATAAISVYTAIQLTRLMADFLTLPSREEMAANRELVVISEARAERAEEVREKLSEFAYVTSHDLKAPVRGLSNHAKFLIEDHGEAIAPDARRRLDRMVELCEHMDRLISTLLRYSRIGRTAAEVDVDPGDAVDRIRRSLAEMLAERHGVIEIETPLPRLRANPADVDTVFRNLIINGLTYNDSDEKVVGVGFCHEVVVNGERLRDAYYVRDNGIGVDPEFREDAFRMFKRLQPRDAYGEGTGAGLAFVRKIAECAGGRAVLSSEPGLGSTFYVTFSAPPKPAPAPDASTAPGEMEAQHA